MHRYCNFFFCVTSGENCIGSGVAVWLYGNEYLYNPSNILKTFSPSCSHKWWKEMHTQLYICSHLTRQRFIQWVHRCIYILSNRPAFGGTVPNNDALSWCPALFSIILIFRQTQAEGYIANTSTRWGSCAGTLLVTCGIFPWPNMHVRSLMWQKLKHVQCQWLWSWSAAATC